MKIGVAQEVSELCRFSSLNPKLFFGFSWWRGDYVFVPSAKMLLFLRQKRKETGNDSADSPASRKSKTHEFEVICVYISARLFAREVNAFSAAFSLFLLLLGDLTFSSFCCIFSISLKKSLLDIEEQKLWKWEIWHSIREGERGAKFKIRLFPSLLPSACSLFPQGAEPASKELHATFLFAAELENASSVRSALHIHFYTSICKRGAISLDRGMHFSARMQQLTRTGWCNERQLMTWITVNFFNNFAAIFSREKIATLYRIAYATCVLLLVKYFCLFCEQSQFAVNLRYTTFFYRILFIKLHFLPRCWYRLLFLGYAFSPELWEGKNWTKRERKWEKGLRSLFGRSGRKGGKRVKYCLARTKISMWNEI